MGCIELPLYCTVLYYNVSYKPVIDKLIYTIYFKKTVQAFLGHSLELF